MKLSLDKMINRLTGRRWQYQVEFTYTLQPGVPNSGTVSRGMTLSVNDRNILADHRHIKKALIPDFVKELPPHLRTNGALMISKISYIGWFRDRDVRPPQTGKLGHRKPFGALV
ncbi:hypothetical protein CNR34_00052 [Pseudomonas phage nickie]|uniref:Uncharacterized protein n=1 Tax=Pseudomonas phage nickie TaxID=2048977 RepID=A0A2H4P739_9CAUD|nr:hypothetical protein FDJ16_gp113 [Pseudomonas phage nickie]ATW57985.1 hypothetical protein CNR34_00052 [Pseudomonas phage nickie]